MIHTVFRDPKFDKQLEHIRKASKKGAIAARKADEIIGRLVQGCKALSEVGVMTKSGERRIKKCTKYDIGCGYRLITVLDGECLFLIFVGTHDECNLWLENNKFIQPRADKPRIKAMKIQSPVSAESPGKQQGTALDDEPPLASIEEKHLRKIFSGLCGCLTEQPGKATGRGPVPY